MAKYHGVLKNLLSFDLYLDQFIVMEDYKENKYLMCDCITFCQLSFRSQNYTAYGKWCLW